VAPFAEAGHRMRSKVLTSSHRESSDGRSRKRRLTRKGFDGCGFSWGIGRGSFLFGKLVDTEVYRERSEVLEILVVGRELLDE
jgi:hypothetical protein